MATWQFIWFSACHFLVEICCTHLECCLIGLRVLWHVCGVRCVTRTLWHRRSVAPTLGGSVLQELRWLDQQTAHAALMQDWFKAEFSLAIIQAAASSATTAFTEWSAFLRVRKLQQSTGYP
jgi:hypothetical protein